MRPFTIRVVLPALAGAAVLLCAGCAASHASRASGNTPAAPGPDAATAEAAPALALHRIPVEGHGALEVSAPPAWLPCLGEALGQAQGEKQGGAVTLELAPEGRAFVLLVTPFSYEGVEADPAQARVDAARLLADLARRKLRGQGTDDDLPLQELSGPGVRGFWFEATDPDLVGREPEAGEYRALLQGAASVGPLLVAFTLLDGGDGPQRDEALRLVATARAVGGLARR